MVVKMLKTNQKMFMEQAEHVEEVREGKEGIPKSNSIAGLITCSCLMYITLCHTVFNTTKSSITITPYDCQSVGVE